MLRIFLGVCTLAGLSSGAGAQNVSSLNSTNASSTEAVNATAPPSTTGSGGSAPFVFPPEFEECPAWFKDYVIFHRQQHGNVSAPRLTWTAHPISGMGFGDRFRGMVYNFRTAASLRR